MGRIMIVGIILAALLLPAAGTAIFMYYTIKAFITGKI